MAYVPPSQVPLWPAFFPSAPVVPKLYYEALSPEQRIKKLCEELHRLCEYANVLGININLDHEAIAHLQEDFQRFIDGGYSEHYLDLLKAWLDEHFADIVSLGMRQVFFGLTRDGYFVAYVPDSWQDLTFDTGMVYGRSDYGRLILRMDVDSPNTLDNTYGPTFSLSELTTTLRGEFATLIADVESVTNRCDTVWDKVFEDTTIGG